MISHVTLGVGHELLPQFLHRDPVVVPSHRGRLVHDHVPAPQDLVKPQGIFPYSGRDTRSETLLERPHPWILETAPAKSQIPRAA